MSTATRLERATHHLRADRADLEVRSGTVVITKQAVTADRPKVVEVGLSQVRGVDLRKPGPGRQGWLHVAAVGGTPHPSSELAAASDPYTVPVTRRNLGAARRLARAIATHVQARGLPPEAVDGAGPGTTAMPSSVRLVTPAPSVPPPGPAADDG